MKQGKLPVSYCLEKTLAKGVAQLVASSLQYRRSAVWGGPSKERQAQIQKPRKKRNERKVGFLYAGCGEICHWFGKSVGTVIPVAIFRFSAFSVDTASHMALRGQVGGEG